MPRTNDGASLAQIPTAPLPCCPHCGSDRTQGHGSYKQMGGAVQLRRRCCECHRTYSTNTGTTFYYLKKPQQYIRLANSMTQQRSIRSAAALVGVRLSTAFRWRHRILAPLSLQPHPKLAGQISAGTAYVRYSEKGSRTTNGPGAFGRRKAPKKGLRPFRRFIDGRPSCVLVLHSGEQKVMLIAGQVRLTHDVIRTCLEHLVQPGGELWSASRDPYAQACQSLGITWHDASCLGGWQNPTREVYILCSGLYSWLRPFRGVATRYLSHYLAWYQTVGLPAGVQFPAAS